MTDPIAALKAEDSAQKRAEFYDSLEDNIMELRGEVRGQAILLKEMQMLPDFCNRILELEHLQRAWDEWEPGNEENE